jgi:hypothetical protein
MTPGNLDTRKVDEALRAAEAVLNTIPGGELNPKALLEFTSQLNELPGDVPGVADTVATLTPLAEKLYSEKGWVEYETPEALSAVILIQLHSLRRRLRGR